MAACLVMLGADAGCGDAEEIGFGPNALPDASPQCTTDVDCAEAFALQPGACVREYHTLHYCDRAGGLDCRHEPAFDESCTVGPNPRPPRFLFCRIDASPPPACVPYLGTSPDDPFAYCCP